MQCHVFSWALLQRALHASTAGVPSGVGSIPFSVGDCYATPQCTVQFVSAVGSDKNGQDALDHLSSLGLATNSVHVADGKASPIFMVILSADGRQLATTSDVSLLKLQPTPVWFNACLASAPSPPSLIIVDGSLDPANTKACSSPFIFFAFVSTGSCTVCEWHLVQIIFEPTSVAKHPSRNLLSCLYLVSPNEVELLAMQSLLPDPLPTTEEDAPSWSDPSGATTLLHACQRLLSNGLKLVLLKLGPMGALLASKHPFGPPCAPWLWPSCLTRQGAVQDLYYLPMQPPPAPSVVHTVGCGDAL
eukprot:gene6315-1127_t